MRLIPLSLVLALASCGTGSPSGPGTCTGECVAAVPNDWIATTALWIGDAGATTPACPSVLPSPLPGFANTPPTVVCPACSCSPSGATCSLPVQLYANPGACPGGAGAVQFNPPHGWDGTCVVAAPVSSTDSLTVAPPPNPVGTCTPQVAGSISIQGSTPALACAGMPSVAAGTCGDQSMICAFPKSAGFSTCVIKVGDSPVCPDGWPTRHLVFPNEQACGCQCGPPVSESCSATVTVYSDGACSNSLGSVLVSSDQPQGCIDVATGSVFESASSTPPVYNAGTCAPMPTNEGEPFTFCCLP
jgi:hypothetical protein